MYSAGGVSRFCWGNRKSQAVLLLLGRGSIASTFTSKIAHAPVFLPVFIEEKRAGVQRKTHGCPGAKIGRVRSEAREALPGML